MKPSPFAAGVGLLLLIAVSAPANSITFTTDTLIDVFDTNYDGADIVVTNCTLTVNGPHAFSNLLVAAGGTLTHTLSSSGTLSLSRSFLDEAQILNGTNAVSLLNTGALAMAEVTDLAKTVTYTNDQDYAWTSPGNGLIQLQRTTNSTIPDGATVLVSYSMQISVPAGLNLSIAADIEIASGGAINVNGRGYGGSLGPGQGGEAFLSGGGAGYGGYGGVSSSNAPGGISYGSATQPVDLGSGGGFGAGDPSSFPGGPGGGAVKIIAGGDVIINGIIAANGANATNSRSGGGAGGSIWLSGQTITGAGSITATGGAGEPIHGGGGGGGRIALQADTNDFTGSLSAHGGVGATSGGAGTIYTKLTSDNGSLVVDNGGLIGATTLLQVTDGADVKVRGNAVCVTSSSQAIGNLLVSSNGVVSTSLPNTPLTITATGNAIVEAGGLVTVDGKGTQGIGTGAGAYVGSGIYFSGGGGHGGCGGMGGNPNARGGGSFDSTISPTGFGGVGGGSGSSFSPFGGLGGGAIRITVNGNLTLNGTISADGKVGSGAYAGGGAGGSVWLTLGRLSGSGSIHADGGPGILPGGGGGGGGRIAITANSNTFSGTITARGGNGTNWGGAGTIYLWIYSQGMAQLLIENGGHTGTNTTFDSTSVIDVIASAGGVAQMPGSSWSVHTLLIHSNGTLTSLNSPSSRTVSANGDVTINAGGVLSLDGKGYGAGQGTGRGFGNGGTSGGGGYGGYGGANPSFISGWGGAYGLINNPTDAGSGGGSGSGSTFPPLGGGGGGALVLNVSGTLTVNGRLSVNGGNGDLNSGGGSGGSVNIQCGPLRGSGIISANGGAGTGNGGGGAGGRMLIAFGSNGFSGTLAAYGGSGIVPGGAGTIYTKPKTIPIGDLLVSNGGSPATNTPFSSGFSPPPSPFNLTISDGARLVPVSPLPLLSNLTVTAGGVLTTLTNQTNLIVPVVKNVNVAAGGAISVNGKGFARAAGPGAGTSLSNQGSGGGYGGTGGNSASGAPGGTNYGSATLPVDRGSGGGPGANIYFGGSEGGGAIRLIVGGTLNVDGTLSADGNPGLQDDSGGGAGGSIWVTAGALSGNGFISANGGGGELFGGGGGGGGRIAIQSPSNTFAGTITALGGFGANFGGDGSVFSSSQLPTIQGTVTDTNGFPVAGVLLQTSTGTASTTTAADGTYALSLVPYTSIFAVTPSMSGFMFVPGSRSYSSSLTSVTNADYLMISTIAPTIASGLQDTNVVVSWFGVPGVSYQLYYSTNLVNWLPYGSPVIGTNASVELPVPVDSDPAKFFRVRASN